MRLRPGGIDVFYIDESHDSNLYVVTAIAVPFMRQVDGMWHIVWPDWLSTAQEWRRRIARDLKIPTSKELHGTKLASGRGNYLYGKRQLQRPDAINAYCKMLNWIDFVPDASIITVAGARGHVMYGQDRLQRVMYALFQRMRNQCVARNVNAMTFFDQGHPEYRELYRRARVHLPTGSSKGAWQSGAQRNMPLDMFVKDGNEKNSAHCLFTQAADLIAFAALAKIRGERNQLSQEQMQAGLAGLYDEIPVTLINLRASNQQPRDGIVRML